MEVPVIAESPDALLSRVSFADALQRRRSVRRFAQRAVPADVLHTALQAGSTAPSPHGTRPWRFCILESAVAKQQLATAMGEDFLRDMRLEGVPEAMRHKRHAGSLRLLTGAPALILASLSYADLDRYDDPVKQAREHLMAEHSLGGALLNVMTALAVLGVGSVWRCAPLFCPETARQALALPKDWVPRALIVAGYPLHAPQPRAIAGPVVITR
jgi:coenzyme F420-0:L-glutamate ligase / coenzyme F420-1:gamma-L-glutamate ligase